MVLIFDLDGVLVGSTFFSDILIEMLYQKFQEQNLVVEKPVIFKEILKRFIEKLGAENKSIAYDWDFLIQEYLSEYNISWGCEIEQFFRSDELINYIFLYTDTDILKWLLNKGYIMTILTNGLPKYQNHVIEKLKLPQYFKKIIMPNPKTIKIVKPYPEIFKMATKGFQGKHVMIGDSLYFDIYGANKAGYETIWIYRRLSKKIKKLSIQARTEKLNQNTEFLLKNILHSAPFLKLSPTQGELIDFKPDYIIGTLQELKELF
ncbi:MAG: HAD family hydrolase [Promethearchaeota archaeon]